MRTRDSKAILGQGEYKTVPSMSSSRFASRVSQLFRDIRVKTLSGVSTLSCASLTAPTVTLSHSFYGVNPGDRETR